MAKGKTVEYSPVTTFPVSTNYISDEKFDREKWRDDKIKVILSTKAHSMFKYCSHMIDFKNDIFVWNDEKVGNLDDVQLTFIQNLCENSNGK